MAAYSDQSRWTYRIFPKVMEIVYDASKKCRQYFSNQLADELRATNV